MARVIVMSDNLATRVEVGRDWETGEPFVTCDGCANGVNLVEGTNEGAFEDMAEVARIHADQCSRCADDTCTTPRPHDAGHRCRKP